MRAPSYRLLPAASDLPQQQSVEGVSAQAGVGDANIELLKRFYVDTALSSEACFLSHTQYTHARVDTKYDQPTGHCSVLKVLWVVVDVHWSLTAAAVCT